jgi:lysophospholipase L1-like esterase
VRIVTAAVTTAALLAAGAPAGALAQEPAGAVAAAGDSITRAFNAGPQPFADAPQRSWATGEDRDVRSHYRRLLRQNPALRGRAVNVARTGARVADLAPQLGQLAALPVGYVTILIGANDACTVNEAAMTPVDAFGTQFETALAGLVGAQPGARVRVVSVPDVYRLWALSRRVRAAREVWRLFGLCQSMLARPTSLAHEDSVRRRRVRQRIVDYNGRLAAACARHANCVWDGGAAFRHPFRRRDISPRDYFHPSAAGQRTLAEVSWSATAARPAGLQRAVMEARP